MRVERKQIGPWMRRIVVHGEPVYLAGQVAFDAPGAPVADQTRDTLARIDNLLAEAGSGQTENALGDAIIDPDTAGDQ